MDSVISSYAKTRWANPVGVRIGYGSSELIRGPDQALDYLTHRWPVREGRYYELAKLRCAAAAERRGSAEEAREVFISAAIEAYVFA
jgi:hypothetical protein